MFAFTRLREPSGTLLTAGATSNYVMSRIVANGSQYPVNTIRCHFSGFASTKGGNSQQETVLQGNDTLIDGFYLQTASGQVWAQFGGSTSLTIAGCMDGRHHPVATDLGRRCRRIRHQLSYRCWREANPDLSHTEGAGRASAAFYSGNALPFTVLLNQLGQNDMANVYSTMRANYKGFITRFQTRYPGVRIDAIGVFRRTTSSDNFFTRSGQSQAVGNEWALGAVPWGAGNKWQLEATMEAGMDGTLSFYIDTRPAWLDVTAPATWLGPAYVAPLAVQAGTMALRPINDLGDDRAQAWSPASLGHEWNGSGRCSGC
jgi:hypothetical protein